MSKLTRALRSLFRSRSTVSPAAADPVLEGRLLARYDAVHPNSHPPSTRRLPMKLSSRIAVTACATLAFGLVAFKAPAQVAVSLGRSVAVTLAPGAPLPDTEAFAGFFQRVCHPVEAGGSASCEVGVRVQQSSEGPTTIHFDVWCAGLPESLSDAMRAEFPEL